MTRLSRNDWINNGFEVLATEGAAGLTIENLTSRLCVTKGSFYHHFQSAEDFKNALLSFWVDRYTTQIVQFTEANSEPEEFFHRFLEILASEDPYIEITLRSWASIDDDVRGSVQRIDEERVEQVQIWFGKMGLDAQKAKEYSRMFYALLIGCYSIFPPVSGPELIQMVSRFLITIGAIKEK